MGEHLKRARLDRAIQQRDAASEIGCDPGTLLNWEKGRVLREAEGLSEEALARKLGLDPGTVGAWEREEVRRPFPRIRRVFERWLASPAEPLSGRPSTQRREEQPDAQANL